MAQGPSRHLLQVIIVPDCVSCMAARQMFERLTKLELPNVSIVLTDLSAPGVEIPGSVFAVPTYILDGRVYSLGSPEEESLVQILRELSSERNDE